MSEKPMILVVEDDDIIQRSLRRILRGYNLVFATKISEAKQVFQEHAASIRMIILDGSLTYKNDAGTEITEKTYDLYDWFLAQGFDGPLVVHSSDTSILNYVREAGCRHVLQKPVSDLPRVLHGLLQAYDIAPGAGGAS